MPSLILSLVMFGTILFTNTLSDNMITQVLIGGTVGFGVYLGGSFLFKFPELEEVKYLLSRKK